MMNVWTPLDAALWTMGQLLWPALLLGGAIVTVSIVTRDKRPLLFLSSLALSEALLFAAGLFQRQLANPTLITLLFLTGQVALLVGCGFLSRNIRMALFLASLCFIYALLASFAAAMGFAGDWL